MATAYGSTVSSTNTVQQFADLLERLVLTKTGLQVEFDVYRDDRDFADMYLIWQEIVDEGQTYPQDTTTEHLFRDYFLSHHCFVFRLVGNGGHTIGGFYIKPNFPGRSAHLANCGLAIKKDYRSHGLGHHMMERIIKYGKLIGYQALYTNLVFCSNPASITVCKKFGFVEVGRLPRAGNLKGLGYVDALQLYRDLSK